MYISSRNFIHQSMIPPQNTCDGANISPTIVIQGVPPGAQSLVITMESEGNIADKKQSGKIHWMVWNISPDTGFIPEDTVPKGAVVGINDFMGHGYGGPYPPIGECHRYKITIYALDRLLNLPSSATKDELDKTIKNKILDQDELVGLYKRN